MQINKVAASSHDSGTKLPGFVSILRDFDGDLTGCHVLIVEDVIDTETTLP
jgi:hypoxanthine phosphoribosyltransferase